MKLIVAGSRTCANEELVYKTLRNIIVVDGIPIREIVCGMAKGVDMFGHIWATAEGFWIKEFPANWDKYGKSAGYKRNVDMAKYADACIVFWDGKSRGSKHMIDIAFEHELWVKVVKV